MIWSSLVCGVFCHKISTQMNNHPNPFFPSRLWRTVLPTRLHSSALMSQTFLSRGKMVRNNHQIIGQKRLSRQKGENFDIFSGVNRKQLILRLCPPGSKSLRPIIKAKTVFLLYLALGEFIYCTSRHYTTLCLLRTQLIFMN